MNRAYNMAERRSWWLLRLESILYVLIGAHLALFPRSQILMLTPTWRGVDLIDTAGAKRRVAETELVCSFVHEIASVAAAP